jgi:hypothetical protein
MIAWCQQLILTFINFFSGTPAANSGNTSNNCSESRLDGATASNVCVRTIVSIQVWAGELRSPITLT